VRVAKLHGRRAGPLGVVLLLILFALGLMAGTGSARFGSAAQTTATTTTTAATATETTSTETTTTTTGTTTAETTTAQTTTTIQLTAGQTTTVNRLGAGGVAVIGAASGAEVPQNESGTQWGWIAFGILAAAVVVFGIVWFVRRPKHAS
jgi:hypothetical protein